MSFWYAGGPRRSSDLRVRAEDRPTGLDETGDGLIFFWLATEALNIADCIRQMQGLFGLGLWNMFSVRVSRHTFAGIRR